MFGYGGIFVEVFKDVSFRLAPFGRNEARRMVRQIKGFKLLDGFRGKPKSDISVLEQAMVRLSDMAVAHPEIKELDINPMLAHPDGEGATVADCRIILEPPEEV
jgi:acetyltransferase